MANSKEIMDRMKSIQDTMKITSAMYMISSSKLKKARKDLEATEPYFYSLQSTIQRIRRHLPDFECKYYNQREDIKPEDRKTGYIVVTADKGMAGAYNHNVLKLAHEHIDKSPHPMLFVLGELGRQYFEKKGVPIDMNFRYTVQDPTMNRARNISEKILELFKNEELDEVYIIYTKMINAVQCEATIDKLVPLEKTELKIQIPADVPMETIAMVPSPEELLDHIVPSCVSGLIYGALVESYSSEQNARMMAMEAANKSAKDMLRELGIIYNRARQAAITQEITEVISGAKAQKKKKQNR